MIGAQLTAFLHCDPAGIVRGRLVPADRVPQRVRGGVGWVPANVSLTPFGGIADPNPHGSIGDVRLVPDPQTRVQVPLGDEVTALDFFLCDIAGTDGRPWECCPRTFLARALADLEREAGVRLLSAFEHEFQLLDDTPPPLPFTLTAQRRVEPFGPAVVAALQAAGAEPEVFIPEYGEHQFEITCAPAMGVAAADRSIIVKEVVREVGRLLGRPVTFAPLLRPGAVGNGAHIHFSFVDADGGPAGYDDARPGRLSEVAGQFAAGVLAHAPALAAFATPGAASFLRIGPHRWNVGAVCLGDRNRETILRIAPVLEMAGDDPAAQANLEYRAADATACPYLLLGALARAGLDGIRRRLEDPPILDRDPTLLTEPELAGYGAPELPQSLDEALEALERDGVARRWLPPLLHETYVGVKRAELAIVDGLDDADICRRYAAAY